METPIRYKIQQKTYISLSEINIPVDITLQMYPMNKHLKPLNLLGWIYLISHKLKRETFWVVGMEGTVFGRVRSAAYRKVWLKDGDKTRQLQKEGLVLFPILEKILTERAERYYHNIFTSLNR
jgi:hypothetical protein